MSAQRRVRDTVFLLVFGGRRGRNNGGIDDSAFLQNQIRDRSDSLQPWQKTSRGCRSGSTDCGTFLSCLRPESDCLTLHRQKSEKARLSITSFRAPISDRSYRFCSRVDPEHQFQLVGLISVLPLVIVRSDQLLQLAPRHDPLDPFQQYFLVRADFFQFVVQKRHTHLLVHVFIIAHFLPGFQCILFCAVMP